MGSFRKYLILVYSWDYKNFFWGPIQLSWCLNLRNISICIFFHIFTPFEKKWPRSPNFTRRHISMKVIPHQKGLLKTKQPSVGGAAIGFTGLNLCAELNGKDATYLDLKTKSSNIKCSWQFKLVYIWNALFHSIFFSICILYAYCYANIIFYSINHFTSTSKICIS